MDPKANILRQRELAAEAQKIQDNCSDCGEYTDEQTERLSQIATELAELVLALDEWRKKGGFDPYLADPAPFKLSTKYHKEFLDAYIEAALWSTNDNSDESGGEPLDKNYGVDDIDPLTLVHMGAECHKFAEDNHQLLDLYEDMGRGASLAGHDFWLTRCGHGTGFWDRNMGLVGDKLSDAATAAGNRDLYVGDDGKVHQG